MSPPSTKSSIMRYVDSAGGAEAIPILLTM
jgi:hypothetical protein